MTTFEPEHLPRRTIKRRLPRPSEIRPLLKFRQPRFDVRERRLAAAHTIDDLRTIARRRTPRPVFDYVDGAAEQEISIGRARQAFENVELHPRVLQDVTDVDPSTSVLGGQSALPLVLAPTGFTRMMHHEGEIAVARAAARARIPYVLSTMGTTDLEDVRACAPSARQWFQLYLWKDRAASEALVERAARAGYEALVLTVDTPIGGARMRDVRNGLTIPPTLTVRTLAGIAVRPSWWMNLLTTEPLQFAALNNFDGTVEELIGTMFDPSLTIEDLRWLRELWPGKLIVKGIQSVTDAEVMAGSGVDALVLSNHGGRQLDRAPTPLELLPRVVDAVGDDCEIILDTGVRTGADLVAARALGASAAMVGRAYLYGLMAAGEQGVDRAIEILRAEYTRTLRLLGVVRTAEISSEHATLRLPARG
ncbi:alpha-hydroxy-acid oxidizing protein [Amycolatopsis sp. NPDC059235]|uniref:alpha-hydroxy acid oxidase n=1 Tax=Amycolatopsis sp. NPDC059235 TaxID=3346782 RepID=UPI003672F370